MQIVIIHYMPREMIPGSVPHVNRIAKEFAAAKHGSVIVAPPGVTFELLQLDGDEVDVVMIEEAGKKAKILKQRKVAKKINHPGQIATQEGAPVIGESGPESEDGEVKDANTETD